MIRFLWMPLLVGAFFVGPVWGKDDDAADRARGLRNNSCAKFALWIVYGVHDDGDLPAPELMKYCNDATPSVCRAATGMILENGKQSPLTCKKSEY